MAGSGTTCLTISGCYAQVNADLKTPTDTESGAGADVITLTASDSLGAKAAPVGIAVTVTGAPSGAPNTSLFAQAAALAGAQSGVGSISADLSGNHDVASRGCRSLDLHFAVSTANQR